MTTKDKTKADQAGKAAIDELFDKFGKAISETEESGVARPIDEHGRGESAALQ